MNRRDASGADGAAAFADGEAHAGLEGDGALQAEADPATLAGMHEAVAGRSVEHFDGAGHVGRAEEELRLVPGAERRVPATLTGVEHVNLRLSHRVRLPPRSSMPTFCPAVASSRSL